MARKILEGVALYANHSADEIKELDVKKETAALTADTTVPAVKEKVITGNIQEGVLFIIDGTVSNTGGMEKLDPNDVKSVDVLKGENAVKTYGEKGKNGVIIITTKNYNPKASIVLKTPGKNPPLYVVDGNFISSDELQMSLSPEDIVSMNVIKGEDAVKEYGEKGKNGVIEITSKKKTEEEGSATFFSAPAIVKIEDKTKNTGIEIRNTKEETTVDSVLYIIDGKVSTKENVNNIKPDNIESVNVLKGKDAVDKYGEKAKNGTIEIKLKN